MKKAVKRCQDLFPFFWGHFQMSSSIAVRVRPVWLALLLLGLMALVSGAEQAGERFVLVFDGQAVQDAATGLVWEREPDTFHGTWSEAPAHCTGRTVGGQHGWRVPTVQELKSLIDLEQHDPALPSGHPFRNIKSAIYWTATPSDTDDIIAWHVSFLSGEAVTDQKSQTRRVWCVREGDGAASGPSGRRQNLEPRASQKPTADH
jgi:hypothetical protein